MTPELETQAEIVKLARLLETEPERLRYLVSVSPHDLARFRDQVADALYARTAGGLRRMAAASRVMPGALAAAIAGRVLGPMLCARLAGMIEPDRAVDIAKRLPPEFLADVAVHIDPRRASDVVARLPTPLVLQGAAELVRRREYVAMGRFVGHLPGDTIRIAIGEIDEQSLLRVAFVMEGKERLDHVISLFPDERIGGILDAAEEEGLWAEALDLMDHLGPQLRERFEQEATSHDGFRAAMAPPTGEVGT